MFMQFYSKVDLTKTKKSFACFFLNFIKRLKHTHIHTFTHGLSPKQSFLHQHLIDFCAFAYVFLTLLPYGIRGFEIKNEIRTMRSNKKRNRSVLPAEIKFFNISKLNKIISLEIQIL